MLTVRGTKKFLDRVGRPTTDPPPSTTVLGDWYASVLFWRPQVALFVNATTFVPVLTPLAPASGAVARFPGGDGRGDRRARGPSALRRVGVDRDEFGRAGQDGEPSGARCDERVHLHVCQTHATPVCPDALNEATADSRRSFCLGQRCATAHCTTNRLRYGSPEIVVRCRSVHTRIRLRNGRWLRPFDPLEDVQHVQSATWPVKS